MDVVYLLKKQSDYSELYYSLRSIAHVPHDQVFIVWPLVPKFVKNVIHISCTDKNLYRTQNTYYKVLQACNDERVSAQFILMNDDFYITRPIDEVPYLYKWTIATHLKARNHSRLRTMPLTKIIENTFSPEDKDYEIHAPIVLDKKKFIDLPIQNWMMIYRSLYCKTYWIEWEYQKDLKIKHKRKLKEFKLTFPTFISSWGKIMEDPVFTRLLEKKLPKSKYVR